MVFFKKHTPIKIFKPRLVDTLYHKNVNSSSKKHIFEPPKRFGQSDFKTASLEILEEFECKQIVKGEILRWSRSFLIGSKSEGMFFFNCKQIVKDRILRW